MSSRLASAAVLRMISCARGLRAAADQGWIDLQAAHIEMLEVINDE
jgi:hypothetical protein